MSDKYDLAVKFFEDYPENIPLYWRDPDAYGPGRLFQFITPSGCADVLELRDSYCGCLTTCQVDGGAAWTEELRQEIIDDPNIPDNIYKVTVKHLPYFADWQRRIDREIRGFARRSEQL